MNTVEVQDDDDQVRQDSTRGSALFQQHQLSSTQQQTQQQQQPDGSNVTPNQSGTLPVLAESSGNVVFQQQQQNQPQQQPLHDDAPVFPVLNHPLHDDENETKDNKNNIENNQQYVPAPPPPPKRSLNEIVEAFKSAVGVGEGAGRNPASPLATRSNNTNNNNSNNAVAAAAVTGLKAGVVAKKKKKLLASSGATSQNNSRPSSVAGEVGNNRQEPPKEKDHEGIAENTTTTATNANGNSKNDTNRRPSWDRIFANANFGQQVQSRSNVLDVTDDDDDNNKQQLPVPSTSAPSAPPSGKKSAMAKKKKKSGAQSQPETPEHAQGNDNDDDDNNNVPAPVQSEEGPTFVSKKAKQAKLNPGVPSAPPTSGQQPKKPQQVSSRPNVVPPSLEHQQQQQQQQQTDPQHQQQIRQQQQQQRQPQPNPIANTLPVLIRNMSTLEEEASISFVAVRAWVVDRNTGESYNNALFTPAGADTPQLVAIPMVSFPFDIRRRFSTQPEWNQVLDIPTSLPLFGQQQAVLLFEVLSLGNETIRGQIDYSKPQDANEVVAWGFLDLFAPTGDSNEGQDQLVQLFRPSATRGLLWSAALFAMSFVAPTAQSKVQVPQSVNPSSPCIPPIFHEYASSLNRNDTYPAALCVQFQHPHNIDNGKNKNSSKWDQQQQVLQWRTLGGGSGIAPLYPRDFDSLLDSEKLLHRVVFRTNGTTPGRWDDKNNVVKQQQQGPGGVVISGLEGMAAGISDSLGLSKSGGTGTGGGGGGFLSDVRKQQDAKQRKAQRRHAALLRDNRFHREIGERCLPPNTMLHRFEIAGEVTAMATHHRILAIAITSDFKSVLCFYDMLLPNMPLVGSVPGHLDYVHSLKFERNGKVIVSASSDKTVRVWKTDQFGFFIKSESEQAAVCRHTLPHPFHVYDVEFIGSTALVTCGFDTRMYLWSLQTGLLIGTYANPQDAFFRNLAAGGVVADSKLFALDSGYVLSTWRPMEDERTHNVSSLVLRLRVRVPGALALVVKNSIVVLQCLDNPEELNNQNTSNVINSKGAVSGNNGYVDMWNSPMSLVVVDASLLTLVYKISLNSIIMTNSSHFSSKNNANINNNNLGQFSSSSKANNDNNNNKPGFDNNNNETGGAVLKGLGPKSSAFFTTRNGRSRSFILPDGRLIAFADQASRIMFFDSITGELFSSNSGVAVPGASDVPLSCLSWSQQLNLCVSASALAHTDQGRVSEIVVAARPRIDGEVVSDETKIDYLRTLFGGEVNLSPGNMNQQGLGGVIRGGSGSVLNPSNNSGRNNNFGSKTGNNNNNSALIRGGGGGSSSAFLFEPANHQLDLSHEPSLKMHQIVSHWKDVVVKRQANQATLQQQRSTHYNNNPQNNNSFSRLAELQSAAVTTTQEKSEQPGKNEPKQSSGIAGGALAFLAVANKARAENSANTNNTTTKTKKRRNSLNKNDENKTGPNRNDDDDDDDDAEKNNSNKKAGTGAATNDFDEL